MANTLNLMVESLLEDRYFLANTLPLMLHASIYGEVPYEDGRSVDNAYIKNRQITPMGKHILKEILAVNPEIRELAEIGNPIPPELRSEDSITNNALRRFFSNEESIQIKVIFSAATGEPVNSLMGHQGYLEHPATIKKRNGQLPKDDISDLLGNGGVANELGQAIFHIIQEKSPEYISTAVNLYRKHREIIDPVGAI